MNFFSLNTTCQALSFLFFYAKRLKCTRVAPVWFTLELLFKSFNLHPKLCLISLNLGVISLHCQYSYSKLSCFLCPQLFLMIDVVMRGGVLMQQLADQPVSVQPRSISNHALSHLWGLRMTVTLMQMPHDILIYYQQVKTSKSTFVVFQ